MIQHRLYQQPWPEGEYRLFQLGFVVDDVLAVAARWAAVHAVGPFHVLPPIEQACTYRGADTAVELRIAVAQAGPVQIELIEQVCDRPSIFREEAFRRPVGFHQLCTVTPDYERTRAYYAGLGYEIACEIVSGGQRVGYVDTLGDFGFVTEIVEETPRFLEQLAVISATCAAWDGTDPVRLLTRDGYRVP